MPSVFPPGRFCGTVLGSQHFAGFTLTEIVCPPLQKFPEHSHTRPYFSYILEGSYTEMCFHDTLECTPEMLIFHGPKELHSDQVHRVGARVLNLEIAPAIEQYLQQQGLSFHRPTVFTGGYTMLLVLKLQREFSNRDHFSALAIEGLSLQLVAEVLRRTSNQLARPRPQLMQRAIQILNARFREPIGLGLLAAALSVHPVHLAREFRRHFDCTVSDYIRQLRIKFACRELLGSNASVVDIALRAGFSDHSHLARTLKQNIGMSASEFRSTHAAR